MLLIDDHVNLRIFQLQVFNAITAMKQVPEADRDRRCICAACADRAGAGQTTDAPASAIES